MFTCDNGLSSRLDANDLDFFPDLNNTLLNAACHHSASPLNAENIFYREGEGAVQGPGGVWNVVINSLHQLQDGFPVGTWAQSRADAAAMQEKQLALCVLTGQGVLVTPAADVWAAIIHASIPMCMTQLMNAVCDLLLDARSQAFC